MNKLHREADWINNWFSRSYLIKDKEEIICQISIEEWVSVIFYKSQHPDFYDKLYEIGFEDNGEDSFIIRINIVKDEKECEKLVDLIISLMEDYNEQ